MEKVWFLDSNSLIFVVLMDTVIAVFNGHVFFLQIDCKFPQYLQKLRLLFF